MEPSFVGLTLFAVLYAIGRRLGSGPLFGLMLSLPFGSTAFATLPLLGGATPLVYTLFAILLAAESLLRPGAVRDLRAVLARDRSARIVLCLTLLALASAVLLPRLFAGDTTVLFNADKTYVERPLAPSSRNVTQSGYFLLDVLVFFAVAAMLVEKPRRGRIVAAFFAWCVAHTACGWIDLSAKYAGLGDVFAPIRTARYKTLSGDVAEGFPRLTGALPEASTFAMMTLACLAFSFVHWRGTGSRPALVIALANLVLVVLCTSSTAYVALPILCVPLVWQIVGSMRRGRLSAADAQVTLFGLSAVAIVAVMLVVDADLLRPYLNLIDGRIFQKLESPGGTERMYFNRLSIQNFLDTAGVGIGLGSSRSSSWPIAVLAQLGIAGAILLAPLVAVLLRGMRRIDPAPANAPLLAAGNSVCACAAAGMLGASLSGAAANPGIVFFLALAVATSWRYHAARSTPPDEAET